MCNYNKCGMGWINASCFDTFRASTGHHGLSWVREEINIIDDPSTTPFHRRPQLLFYRRPQDSHRRPSYFHRRPPYFHRRPQIFIDDPHIFIGDAKILIDDENIEVADENMGVVDENMGVVDENMGVVDDNMGSSIKVWGLSMKVWGSLMRILGSSIERQLGSSMKWGRRWVVDDDDFFPDSFIIGKYYYM